MTDESAASWKTPYTPYPGASMPSAETTPAEGTSELWSLFFLALVNTLIIAVAGIATWLWLGRP